MPTAFLYASARSISVAGMLGFFVASLSTESRWLIACDAFLPSRLCTVMSAWVSAPQNFGSASFFFLALIFERILPAFFATFSPAVALRRLIEMQLSYNRPSEQDIRQRIWPTSACATA